MRKNIIYIHFLLGFFLLIFFNCQQASSGSGGGGSSGDDSPSIVKVNSISSGEYYTIALLSNGTIKCWGSNQYGQLGYGDIVNRGDNSGEMGDLLPAVDLGTGRTAVQIAAGGFHSTVLLDNGTVKCWGYNSNGQLGYGDTANRGDNLGEMGDFLLAVDLNITGWNISQIKAGGFHTIVLYDGLIKNWGGNAEGQLGYNDTENRGDGPGEMGSHLLSVNYSVTAIATQMCAGRNHTVVLLDNGTIKCWGRNDHGQLGYGDTTNRGDGVGGTVVSLPAVSLGTGRTAVQIAAGYYHTVVLLDNGTVKCWGANSSGQLGYGDTDDRGDGVGDIMELLPVVDLGAGRTAVQIAAGGFYTIALLDDGTVKCWGNNSNGQLGYEDTANRGDNPGEMGDLLPAVNLGTGRTAVQITAGANFVAVLLDNGTVKCWGQNNYGQLGYGDTTNRGDNPGEMGDNLPVVDL